MNSFSLATQDQAALKHLRDLENQREVDWIGQKTSQNLQDAMHVVTILIIAMMIYATISSTRTILEEINVLGVTGFIGLRTARRRMEETSLQIIQKTRVTV